MPRKPKSHAAGSGHNSVDRDKLRSLVSRIEAAEDERIEITEHIRGLYQEARSSGLDAKAIRTIVRMRKQDAAERAALQSTIDEYLAALGMLQGTPLGDYAIARASQMMPV